MSPTSTHAGTDHIRAGYARARARLAELSGYEAGWLDGHGTPPRPDLLVVAGRILDELESAVLADAVRTCPNTVDHQPHPDGACGPQLTTLRPPALFVREDGGLLLEWHRPGGVCSAELGDDPLLDLLTVCPDDGDSAALVTHRPWSPDDGSLLAVLALFVAHRPGDA